MCTPPPRANPLPPPLQSLIETQRVAREKAQLLYPVDAAYERLRQQKATFKPSYLSEADKTRLAHIRARETARRAKHERRQALKPAALFARLKARAARVSWDSWG